MNPSVKFFLGWFLVEALLTVGLCWQATEAEQVQAIPKFNSPTRMAIDPAKTVLDIRMGQRTVFVWDPNHATMTLVPGGVPRDVWVCAPHDGGKACKHMGDVYAWVLHNADESQ